MRSIRDRERSRSPGSRCVQILIVLVALAASACTGIVIQPVSETSVNGSTVFWGYALEPGQTIALEAQHLNGNWLPVATTVSVTTPTATGGNSGYYFAVSYDPRTLGSTFRRTSPVAGRKRVFLRLKSDGRDPADTRSYQSNGTNPGPGSSNLMQAWASFRTSDSILRLDIPN